MSLADLLGPDPRIRKLRQQLAKATTRQERQMINDDLERIAEEHAEGRDR